MCLRGCDPHNSPIGYDMRPSGWWSSLVEDSTSERYICTVWFNGIFLLLRTEDSAVLLTSRSTNQPTTNQIKLILVIQELKVALCQLKYHTTIDGQAHYDWQEAWPTTVCCDQLISGDCWIYNQEQIWVLLTHIVIWSCLHIDKDQSSNVNRAWFLKLVAVTKALITHNRIDMRPWTDTDRHWHWHRHCHRP